MHAARLFCECIPRRLRSALIRSGVQGSVTAKSQRKLGALGVSEGHLDVPEQAIGVEVKIGNGVQLLSERALLEILWQVVPPVLVLGADLVEFSECSGEVIESGSGVGGRV